MIKDLSHVPSKPGVYQFFDSSKIIYIGKAKDLNKRVRSYFCSRANIRSWMNEG